MSIFYDENTNKDTEVEGNNLFNNNSDVLNFSREEQLAINEIVVFSLEYYTEICLSKKVIFAKNDISMKKLENNYAKEFFKYGINLIFGGLVPEALTMLMENAFIDIMDSTKSNADFQIIKLQLLYVKQAISLLHHMNINNCLLLAKQLSSSNVPINKYHNIFLELNMME